MKLSGPAKVADVYRQVSCFFGGETPHQVLKIFIHGWRWPLGGKGRGGGGQRVPVPGKGGGRPGLVKRKLCTLQIKIHAGALGLAAAALIRADKFNPSRAICPS